MPGSCGEEKPQSLSSREGQELGEKQLGPRPAQDGELCASAAHSGPAGSRTLLSNIYFYFYNFPPPSRPWVQNWKRVHSFSEAKTSWKRSLGPCPPPRPGCQVGRRTPHSCRMESYLPNPPGAPFRNSVPPQGSSRCCCWLSVRLLSRAFRPLSRGRWQNAASVPMPAPCPLL